MQRRLVLNSEDAGHSFRRSLPPADFMINMVEGEPARLFTREDTHLFALSFFAFFVAVYTFIS